MNEKLSKISIFCEADQIIDQMLIKVNVGFTGGRITKTALTSWIISHFERNILETQIDKIRKDHFNQVTYLESVIREIKHARKNGSTEPNLSSLLAPVTSSLRGQKKKDQERPQV